MVISAIDQNIDKQSVPPSSGRVPVDAQFFRILKKHVPNNRVLYIGVEAFGLVAFRKIKI